MMDYPDNVPVSYDGYTWPNLATACDAMGIDIKDITMWGQQHSCPLQGLLAAYIKNNYVMTRGLIFRSLDAAVRSWGLSVDIIMPYLAMGFGLDLSCYMALHNISPDVFQLKH